MWLLSFWVILSMDLGLCISRNDLDCDEVLVALSWEVVNRREVVRRPPAGCGLTHSHH